MSWDVAAPDTLSKVLEGGVRLVTSEQTQAETIKHGGSVSVPGQAGSKDISPDPRHSAFNIGPTAGSLRVILDAYLTLEARVNATAKSAF